MTVAPESAAPVLQQNLPSLRGWQKAAYAEYFNAAKRDFLLVATPGAGKTTYALTIAKQPPAVDLVITDVNMPNMDGITLVRELRLLPHFRGVPLLVLTTEATEKKKQEGKAAGATGWIVKPFDPQRLLSAVARVVG